MPLDYAGKTLRGRPFKPGEDLREANFSGANLRGVNFKGLDLSGANFSHADIRGANFSNTILRGANFTRVKAGLQKRWLICIVILSLDFSNNSCGIGVPPVFEILFWRGLKQMRSLLRRMLQTANSSKVHLS
jgi:Pentapeptide repeats (8 copies)